MSKKKRNLPFVGSGNENEMIGQKISHYTILEKLGEGGMGVVYKARDTRLKRAVALKFLPSDLVRDSEAKKRFILEAQAASALDHNNICNIHEIDENEDGQLFIVMACYEGQILSEKIESGPLRLKEAVDVAMQIAEGLAEVHKHGIIHRDIKPANIFVTADGQVKIMDFGIVKLIGAETVAKTRILIGSPGYMSPEQVKGQEIDHRTDIWSLGIVLYEMVTGQHAFKGYNTDALLHSIVMEDPEPMQTLRNDVPHELVRIVDKALSKDPRCRYQKMDEFVFNLQFLYRGLSMKAIDSSRWTSPLKNRIVVLPFANFSPHAEDEYFADGLTEELISTLSKIQELRVIARTSAMKYKTVSKNISEIARELSIGSVLEGSVRKSLNKIRVTVQLIDAERQDHLWAEDYDRELEDIFAVQSDIAQRVAQSLKIHLIQGERQNIEKNATQNMEAYRFYLMGRYHWNKRTREGMEACLQYFEKSVERDKTYALAHAGMADAYVTFGNYGYIPPTEVYPKALSAAENALEIDETLAEAHTSLAVVKCLYEWNWKEGERAFKQAILLNNSYASAHHWYAINFLTPHGLFDEALEEMQKALKFDPLSLIIHSTIGLVYYFARHYDEAIEHFRDTLQMDPEFEAAHYFLGWALEQKGDFETAIASTHKAFELSGQSTPMLAELGSIYAGSGKRDEALAILKELKHQNGKEKISPYAMYSIAAIFTGLGEGSKAIEWLRRAASERCYRLIYLNVDPKFDSLRSHPQFIDLLSDVGLEGQFVAPTFIRIDKR
jgi:serine/threonine protein kinase/Tfp pilus assembly protein PilF